MVGTALSRLCPPYERPPTPPRHASCGVNWQTEEQNSQVTTTLSSLTISAQPSTQGFSASTRPHHVRLVTIRGRPQEPLPCEPVGLLTQLLLERDIMKNLAIYLTAGASALLVTAASAAPLSPNVSVAPESNIQNVRMVCNEAGQCWRERGERRAHYP